MGSEPGAISVTVCYALPQQVWSRALSLPAGATVAQAIAASGFGQAFPDADPARCGAGVYGKMVPLDHVLADHDRVEIYRPLSFDPMESRRRRAAHRLGRPRKQSGHS